MSLTPWRPGCSSPEAPFACKIQHPLDWQSSLGTDVRGDLDLLVAGHQDLFKVL